MKKRNLVIGLLIMLSVIVSGFTFAFWHGTIDLNETESTSITIGSGREVLVTADLAAFNVSLVPVGKEDLSNENNAASSVVLTYTLNYEDTAEYASATTFTTVLNNISLNGMTAERIDFLFNIVITIDGNNYNVTYDTVNAVWLNTASGNITKDAAETITITVTFANEPADADEYDLVATKALTFDVVFTTAQVMNP